MPYEHDNDLVDAIHQVCGDYELPDIFAALMTVTVDNIHLTEHATFREKLETAYIKALTHASAVEEQFHGSEIDPPESAEGADDARARNALFDELLIKIMYRLFVGKDEPTPQNSDGGLPTTRSARLKRVA